MRSTVKDLTTQRLIVLTTKSTHPLAPHIGRGKKAAFTLAEVLITLGIIGVVAAMTLPTLVAKYQMKTFEVAFKKQYSVLNNTIDYLTLEQGLSGCYMTIITDPTDPNNTIYSTNNSDCSALREGLIDKLRLTPITSWNLNYTQKEKVKSNGGIFVNASIDTDQYKDFLSPYLLPDGAVVFMAPTTYPPMGAARIYTVTYIVDVNGKKAPNRWGYDVFWLTLSNRDGKIRLTDEYASLAEKGGRLPRAILTNDAAKGNNRFW